MRGLVLNSAGVYNRCKLTHLVIERDWDKKVWNDSWKAKEEARKEDEELSEAAIKTLAPKPRTEKRSSRQEQISIKRRRLEDGEKTIVWGEEISDATRSRLEFLAEPMTSMKEIKLTQKLLIPMKESGWPD